MARKPAAPAARQSIGIRPRTELKQALEKIAAENGRSLAQEVERRLEQSLEERPQKLGDPIPGVFSDELRSVFRSLPAFAHLIETIADASFQAIHAANEWGRDEIEARTAARAAINAVMDEHLWRGEELGTPIEPPLAPLGARVRDYPPAHLGYEIGSQRVTWLSTWREADAAIDKSDGRIRNLYSGDGRTLLMGPSIKDAEEQRERQRVEAKAAYARGDLADEASDRPHIHKPVRHDPPVAEEGGGLPPRSLKDIMGR